MYELHIEVRAFKKNRGGTFFGTAVEKEENKSMFNASAQCGCLCFVRW